MWLLKLHFAISVLCLLAFIGFRTVGNESIKNNGYIDDEKKKKGVAAYWMFFIPILNIICVIVLFIMIGTTKTDLDKWLEEQSQKKEVNKK